MLLAPNQIQWRKILLVLAGALACSYAFWVLWYVHSTPDIGLRTALSPEIRRIEGNAVLSPEEGSETPKVGDQIVSLNDRKVSTWPHLLQALRELRHESAVDVDALPDASDEHPTFIRRGGTELVRVRFRHPGGGELEPPQTCWCRVGPPSEELLASILWFFLKLGLFFVGALVFWKRPTDGSATQFYLLCIVTLGAYMGGYHWSHIAGQPILILVFMVCSVLLPPVLLHFYCVFPRPKPFLQRFRASTYTAIYGVPLLFLIIMACTYACALWFARSDAPEASVNSALTILLGEIYGYLFVAAPLWYLASVYCLVYSFRTASDATERNQVKWILFGSLGASVPILITLYLAAVERNAFGGGAATWPMFAASVCLTVAFTISITRYRLMQLDQLISSGMIYFAISFVAGLGYYAVVFVAMFVAGTRSGSLLSQALSVSTTTLVLLFILDLARSRLKKALDHRFSREKHQLDRTLRRMGHAVEQLVDPPTLARQLLQASVEVLGPQRGAVYLREGSPPLYRLVDSLGPAPPLGELSSGCPLIEALSVHGVVVAGFGRGRTADPVQRQLHFLGGEVAHALAHEGQLLALLILGPNSLGHYGPEDLNVLAAFSQLTGLALKSAERHRTIDALNRELQTKVQKISEQQGRILALQSQLTRQAVPVEPVPTTAAAPAAPPGGILGSSPVVQRLLQLVHKVSASQSAVLIRGESGTGKELLARALHENSTRSGKAFVKVHCAALSPGLLESELFGHVKGAFTGAHRDKVGRFEFAHGGSLFLDEIGDISLEVQTKLLRVLQEMTFERVGSSEPVHVDVRLIAATHQDLEELMDQRRFREDLYYRLNVISIAVPPLRERREDIAELALHFLRLHGLRSGKNVTQIDDDALVRLKAYPWPGNIRQLENVIERAVVVVEGPCITVAELPVELAEACEPDTAPGWPNGDGKYSSDGIGIRAERAERIRRERERLVRALAATNGNKAEAARALGLARSTLVSRLKKLGLS